MNSRFCQCGHKVKWLVERPLDDPGDQIDQMYAREGATVGHDLISDVIEEPCPHRVLTQELCPGCRAIVGMWGVGAAGSLDCACDETPIARLVEES